MAIWPEFAWLLTRKTSMLDPTRLSPRVYLYDLV